MNEGYMSILESIGSEAPTPGGGTVAALTLAPVSYTHLTLPTILRV